MEISRQFQAPARRGIEESHSSKPFGKRQDGRTGATSATDQLIHLIRLPFVHTPHSRPVSWLDFTASDFLGGDIIQPTGFIYGSLHEPKSTIRCHKRARQIRRNSSNYRTQLPVTVITNQLITSGRLLVGQLTALPHIYQRKNSRQPSSGTISAHGLGSRGTTPTIVALSDAHNLNLISTLCYLGVRPARSDTRVTLVGVSFLDESHDLRFSPGKYVKHGTDDDLLRSRSSRSSRPSVCRFEMLRESLKLSALKPIFVCRPFGQGRIRNHGGG